MNHGPAFQALWAQLRREVRDLQTKGYYGDGQLSSTYTRSIETDRLPSLAEQDTGRQEPA